MAVNHGSVGTYAAADYNSALDKACIDVVSGSLGTFRGGYENFKRSDRKRRLQELSATRLLN